MDSKVAVPLISPRTGTPRKTSRIRSADGRVITVSAAAMMTLVLPSTGASSASLQAAAASRSSM